MLGFKCETSRWNVSNYCRCLLSFTTRNLSERLNSSEFISVTTIRRPKKDGGHGLADNTVRRRCGITRQFVNETLDARLIAENPFAKMMAVAVRANKRRDYVRNSRGGRSGTGRLPKESMATDIRFEPPRGLALPVRALGIAMG